MKTPPPGQVRIIAGQLRGSKLPVADRPGLRPTSDRVRETLFNWLQTMLPGARVLDLFAGTGALGFEAASRGAAEVVLVERDPAFDAGLGTPAAAALAPWLAPSAWIYVESAVAAMPELPPDWQPHRSGKTRDVAYGLFRTG
jgi:16S rRNA (guanine966-N2)-methyltransferase